MGYYVPAQDWPVNPAPAADRLTDQQVLDVLAGVDGYVEPAVASLRETARAGLGEEGGSDA